MQIRAIPAHSRRRLSEVSICSLLCGCLLTPVVLRAESLHSDLGKGLSAASMTSRQLVWLCSLPEKRVKLAEHLGEEGARAFAKSKGWVPIMDGTQRSLLQGPDQIYRDPAGRLHVIEAKGGGSPLGRGYGQAQGSIEWAVESSKRVFWSSKASAVERAGAMAVLEAASINNLEVHVIRTRHVLGEPVAAILEATVVCTDDAAKLAKASLHGIAGRVGTTSDDFARAIGPTTKTAAHGITGLKSVSLTAVPVALVIDGGARISNAIETERKFEQGDISAQTRELEHASNSMGMVGGWAGACVGGKCGTTGGLAAGTAITPGLGTAICGAIGGTIGAIAGYFGGEAAAESASNWVVSSIHSAGMTIAETISAAWSHVTCYAGSAADWIGETWSWIWGD